MTGGVSSNFRGMLNTIDAAKVLSSLRLVRTGEVISLNRPLDDPPSSGRPATNRHARMHNQLRPMTGGRFAVVNDDTVEFAMQGSSHWDSFAHFGVIDPTSPNIVYAPDAPLSETFPEPAAKHIGIDIFWPGIVTRGVLLDIVSSTLGPGAEHLPDDFIIDADCIRTCIKMQESDLEPGDIVLVYTGFERRVELNNGKHPYPVAGVDGSTVPVWEESRIAGLVSDNVAVEALPTQFDLHAAALARMGLPLGELWALHDLALRCRELRRYDFALVSIPLNLPGAFGSPANAIAIF